MSRPRTQAERLATTRAALLKAARTVFAEQGYEAAATEEIVRRAKVTRGALYHHFADKRALFDAVASEVAREIAAKIDSHDADGRSAGGPDRRHRAPSSTPVSIRRCGAST